MCTYTNLHGYADKPKHRNGLLHICIYIHTYTCALLVYEDISFFINIAISYILKQISDKCGYDKQTSHNIGVCMYVCMYVHALCGQSNLYLNL